MGVSDHSFRQLLAGKVLRRVHCLRHQHLEPTVGGHAKFLRTEQKFGAERVINAVQHGFQLGKGMQVQQAAAVVGVHARRGGVDNDIDFRMLLGFLIGQGTVLAGAAGGQHLFGSGVLADSRDGVVGAAGAQHQHHSPGKLHAVAAGQVGKAGIIRIIAIQLAIPVDHGVHCADGRRTWFHLIAIWDDQLFVRDGNIDGFERLCLHKGMGFFLRGQRMQLIGIAAHGLMDDFGIAVAQFGSDQTVFHVALPFCLLQLYYFCPSVP